MKCAKNFCHFHLKQNNDKLLTKGARMIWLVYALLSATTWGFATVLMRLAMQRVDTTLVTTIRTIIMGLMLITITIFATNVSKSSLVEIETKDWLYIGIGSAASCIAWLLYFGAFQHGYVAKVASVDRLSFVFIMFLSALVFDEPLTHKMLMGAGFMIIGIFLIASK